MWGDNGDNSPSLQPEEDSIQEQRCGWVGKRGEEIHCSSLPIAFISTIEVRCKVLF